MKMEKKMDENKGIIRERRRGIGEEEINGGLREGGRWRERNRGKERDG